MGHLKAKPTTRRDAADAVRLKAAGQPAHINAHEARLLERLMPEASGPVITKGLLAEAGRRGDDRVTKLIPAEAALLRSRGGSGTINPATGMPQYYGDGSAADSSHGDGVGPSGESGLGSAATGTNNGSGDGGNNTYSGSWGGGMSLGYERAYDPATMPSVESLLNTINGYRAEGYEDLNMTQYSPPDTFGRLVDTYLYGPPPSYTALGQVPGRYGAPTGRGPGIAATAAANLGGPMMSGLMGLGMHMDQAMSPETRAASMAENQAQGTKNSTGQDSSGRGSQSAGAASGAATSAQLAESLRPSHSGNSGVTVPPGYTVNPAGQLIPLPQQGGGSSAFAQPMQNLLMDYVLRGRSGRGGLLGW